VQGQLSQIWHFWIAGGLEILGLAFWHFFGDFGLEDFHLALMLFGNPYDEFNANSDAGAISR